MTSVAELDAPITREQNGCYHCANYLVATQGIENALRSVLALGALGAHRRNRSMTVTQYDLMMTRLAREHRQMYMPLPEH